MGFHGLTEFFVGDPPILIGVKLLQQIDRIVCALNIKDTEKQIRLIL